MNDYQLLIDLHKHAVRQGPGGEAETKRALALAGLDRSRPLKIADIGCGTGASTVLLAKELGAEITAVDFLSEFLDELQSRAHDHGVADKITTLLTRSLMRSGPRELYTTWALRPVFRPGTGY